MQRCRQRTRAPRSLGPRLGGSSDGRFGSRRPVAVGSVDGDRAARRAELHAGPAHRPAVRGLNRVSALLYGRGQACMEALRIPSPARSRFSIVATSVRARSCRMRRCPHVLRLPVLTKHAGPATARTEATPSDPKRRTHSSGRKGTASCGRADSREHVVVPFQRLTSLDACTLRGNDPCRERTMVLKLIGSAFQSLQTARSVGHFLRSHACVQAGRPTCTSRPESRELGTACLDPCLGQRDIHVPAEIPRGDGEFA